MSRRIEIELTSTRDDGSWTWRAAGAREPKGTLDGAILPAGASVGDVLRAEVEGFLDGLSVVSIVPPRSARQEPERIELRPSRRDDTPLVTADVRRRSSSSDRRRPERGRRRDGDEARGERPRRDRDGDRGRDRDRDRDRDRQAGRHDRGRGEGPGRGDRDRPARPAAEAVEAKPKPKRLRPARTHRAALLESLPSEQRPIAEQLLQGGIPAVRQAIDKQNESLRAEGKPEVGRDLLLKVAEDIRPRAQAALWRDRAEAAVASVDELDLRDLRSVVNAAADAGRDEESRTLATQLREALVNRVEKEHSAWLAELSDTLRDGRVVRALRLSSRPPKAGAPIPTELTNQLADAAAAALTEETGQDRWATVLDALAYSPVRRRVIPQSLPHKLTPALRETVARLGSRLPEIAHIFDIEPDESASAGRTGSGPGSRPPRGRGPRRSGESRPSGGGGSGREGGSARGRGPRGSRTSSPTSPQARSAPKGDSRKPADQAPAEGAAPQAEAPTDAPPATADQALAEGSAPQAEAPTDAPPATADQAPAEGSAPQAKAPTDAPPATESLSSPDSPPPADASAESEQPSEAPAESPSSPESAPPADPVAEPDQSSDPAAESGEHSEPAAGSSSSPESVPPADVAVESGQVSEPTAESEGEQASKAAPEPAGEPTPPTDPDATLDAAAVPEPASEPSAAASEAEGETDAPGGGESNGETRSSVIEAGTMPADDAAS